MQYTSSYCLRKTDPWPSHFWYNMADTYSSNGVTPILLTLIPPVLLHSTMTVTCTFTTTTSKAYEDTRKQDIEDSAVFSNEKRLQVGHIGQAVLPTPEWPKILNFLCFGKKDMLNHK